MIVSYYDAVKEIVGIDNMIGGNVNGPISNIEFRIISRDIFPIQYPDRVAIIGTKIKDIKIVDNKSPFRK